MNEQSETGKTIAFPDDHQVKATVDVLVPLARKFTFNYHGSDEPSGEEYSITFEVLPDDNLSASASHLPLRLTMGNADSTDLIERCIRVLKAGFIRAKGELVIDRLDGHGDGVERCVHLMDVHWFEAVDPLEHEDEATRAA